SSNKVKDVITSNAPSSLAGFSSSITSSVEAGSVLQPIKNNAMNTFAKIILITLFNFISLSYISSFLISFERVNCQTSPSFGENKKAITNNTVATSTMTAPEDKLYLKLKYKPKTDEIVPISDDKINIIEKRFVNK